MKPHSGHPRLFSRMGHSALYPSLGLTMFSMLDFQVFFRKKRNIRCELWMILSSCWDSQGSSTDEVAANVPTSAFGCYSFTFFHAFLFNKWQELAHLNKLIIASRSTYRNHLKLETNQDFSNVFEGQGKGTVKARSQAVKLLPVIWVKPYGFNTMKRYKKNSFH